MFFIKNKKKEIRKEKKIERKEEKDIKKGNLPSSSIDTLQIFKYDTALVKRLFEINTMHYSTFQCKAKMHYEGGNEKQNFTANIRLERDKKIWVSISGFGIEVARALITPDSVKAIEKINKNAYLYSYADIQKIINLEVDFNTLQKIIIGNPFANDGKITDVKQVAKLSTIFISGFDYTNQIAFESSDSTIKQIHLQTTRPVSNSSILIDNIRYESKEDKKIPVVRSYHIQDVKGAALLEMDINKFEFNNDLEFPFSIPSNYKLVQ
ncbi:MAG: DUF4292 domain-containing protein [Chitinophagaceae bacterium]